MKGHTTDQCINGDSIKCFHCDGPHQVGSKICIRHQKETEIMNIQERNKVSFARARQIFEDSGVQTEFRETSSKTFNTHFDLYHAEYINPFILEKAIEQHTGTTPKEIRSLTKNTFVVEVSSQK